MNGAILMHAKEREKALRKLRGEKTAFERIVAGIARGLESMVKALAWVFLLFMAGFLGALLALLLVSPRQAPRLPDPPSVIHCETSPGVSCA